MDDHRVFACHVKENVIGLVAARALRVLAAQADGVYLFSLGETVIGRVLHFGEAELVGLPVCLRYADAVSFCAELLANEGSRIDPRTLQITATVSSEVFMEVMESEARYTCESLCSIGFEVRPSPVVAIPKELSFRLGLPSGLWGTFIGENVDDFVDRMEAASLLQETLSDESDDLVGFLDSICATLSNTET